MFESVQGKAFQLAEYNMYAGNPEYYKDGPCSIRAVTADDIMAAYNKYIKGKELCGHQLCPERTGGTDC